MKNSKTTFLYKQTHKVSTFLPQRHTFISPSFNNNDTNKKKLRFWLENHGHFEIVSFFPKNAHTGRIAFVLEDFADSLSHVFHTLADIDGSHG